MEIVRTLNCTGPAHSKSKVEGNASVADVSLSAACDGVEQSPDVQTVYTVSKNAPAELDVTRSEATELTSSAFEKECNETVDLAAYKTDVDHFESEDFTISKTILESYSAGKIVAHLRQMAQVMTRLCVVNMGHTARNKRSIQAHAYN